MQTPLERARQIRMVIFDVDGVLTDGSLCVSDDGREYKAFYARDGLGMQMLLATGVTIGIITGKTSQIVTHRMRMLGIQHVLQGKLDKLPAFQQLCAELQLEPYQVAYVGDDVNDLPVMQEVGLAIAVADAHPRILEVSHWQTTIHGGRGAAREVCEFIMEAQDTLIAQLSRYGIS
jgi:3-deoxy-D-manno-octulosonate 8-phosphate phosphatase (KDO 8-P phosphatase)